MAIELDHGDKGSKIKNAVTKVGILKLAGDFHGVIVFFFIYPLGTFGKFKRKQQSKVHLGFTGRTSTLSYA